MTTKTKINNGDGDDKKNTFGMAPFGELKGVADAALKIMTGQTQEVKEEEKPETNEEEPQKLTE